MGVGPSTSQVFPHISRKTLTAQERAEPSYFVVSLRMRDFAGLENRIHDGQLISHAEMEAKYLPAIDDFNRVSSWLEQQGFTVTLRDDNHTNVFVRGNADQVEAGLGVTLARVVTSEGEFTSAVSPPTLPVELAPAVLSISGLQKHIRAHHPIHRAGVASGLGGLAGSPIPADISFAYNMPAALTGTGQMIAVICPGLPLNSDITAFWSECGVNQSIGNLSVKNINGGSAAGTDAFESTLDLEWASSIAPAARVRLYEIPDFLYSSVTAAATQVLNDLPQNPGLRQVSVSITGPEDEAGDPTTLESFSQTYAQLAAAGVTVLFCSGDGGSNPNPDNDPGYSTSFPLSVSYPGSDPNVTAVGGTALSFDSGWSPTGEVAWFEISPPGTTATVASGGGTSGIFPRPSWQVGQGVPSGPSRCVPDVSAQADSAFLVLNGLEYTCWGTSLATPIWGGILALMNESRSSAGQDAVGLLSRRVYPLIGSNAFNDITSGQNGAYSAGVGYDLCTGVGSPNVANLITQIVGSVQTSSVTRLVNISTRATVGTGGDILIPGLVIGGSGTETLLIRGDGPSLAQFSVPGILAAPSLSVYDSSQHLIASNTGWNTNSDPAQIVAVAAQVGAFAFPAGSLDCALIVNLPAGAYTVQISGVGNTTGVALAEVYEVSSSGTARLINISTRATVGTGGNILIPGFVIRGTGSEQLLVRGDGPSLAQFSVPGILMAPSLSLYDSAQAVIASNTGWTTASNNAEIATVAASVGAFAFPAGSADSAQIVNLPPGAYTIQISGVGDTTGVALAEVYEVP